LRVFSRASGRERKGAIADHSVARSGGITGVAQTKEFGDQTAARRFAQKTAQRDESARLISADRLVCQGADGLDRRPIALHRPLVGKVVAEIGADDDKRFRSAPHRRESISHRLGGGIAGNDGDEPEFRKRALQERQMYLERVLLGMGGVVDAHAGQHEEARHRRLVDRDRA